ncbi:MAG: sialidase family protein [Candidatus Dormiibacterota bacterium]
MSAAECASGLCAELASTIDGGKTWRQLPSPPVLIASGTVDCSKAVCISHIRFATRMLGYLYGPALLVTSNGGQSWRPEESLPVEALEPTHGQVYRIVYDHGGCPGPCDRTVEVASAGSAAWRTVLSIPFMAVESRQDSAQLVTQGSQDIYIAIYGDLAAGGGTQQAVLFRSLDAGRTWRRFGDPCGGSGAAVNDAISLAASTGGFVVTLCVPRIGNSRVFVVTSSNGGTTWGPPHPAPSSVLQLIAAASPTHLALATGPTTGSGPITYTLYVSGDGGAHWSLAVSDPEYLDAAAPGSAFLGFEDSLVGRWVGFERAIWTTQDGGALWTRRPFP